MHEAQMHEENCVITLTYDDQHLPPGGTLVKSDYTKFMYRLREKLKPKRIRFFHCGEYGEIEADKNKPQLESRLGRPHYHACIFNHQFSDLVLYQENTNGNVYESKELEKIWGKGFVTTMDLTLHSAGYVAQYITKKINGDKKDEHYQKVCENTGDIYPVLQEYATMSNKPGIANAWYKKYKKDVYPSDDVIVISKNSYHHVPTPGYYDRQLEKEDSELLQTIKKKREEFAHEHIKDNTLKRLITREVCKKAQVNHRQRNKI